MKQPIEIPQANWNNHALIRALGNPETQATALPLIAARFTATLKADPVFVIATDDGHWGRGITLRIAAEHAVDAGARRTAKAHAWVVVNDPEPVVNDFGTLVASSQALLLSVGVVGTVGGILNATKS